VTAVLLRLLRQLPLFRAYPALLDARQDNAALRSRAKVLNADLERARQTIAQRDVAIGSIASGDARLASAAFDFQALTEMARQRATTYRAAEPFPHFVEDGLCDASYLAKVLEEFEAMDRGGWRHSEGDFERKWSTDDVHRMGPFTVALIAQFNSGPFIDVLEALTGITGLVPDPHLRGGGLHEIRRGGLLGVHADFNLHPRLQLYRRLNLLIYLNTDWEDDWGGALELWDRDGRRSVRSIAPVFNRAVLFDTSNFSYHGHPHPLACPPERSRKSVALYYYTAERPPGEDATPHGTVFAGRT
jgi:hypothetical protein